MGRAAAALTVPDEDPTKPAQITQCKRPHHTGERNRNLRVLQKTKKEAFRSNNHKFRRLNIIRQQNNKLKKRYRHD